MYNKVADGLADLTMDRRCTWEQRFQATREIQSANVIVQTDGGLRENDIAAAAWIIGLWSEDGQYEPLVAHGTLLEAEIGVFAAEAIALHEATAMVQQLIAS